MTTVEINGLKDMIACNTRISSIIDDHLSYAGYDILWKIKRLLRK